MGAILSPASSYAGGGGVDTRITTGDDPHWQVLHVYFDPNLYTCKGMKVSFSFANPESGDVVSGLNGDNSSTITEDAHYVSANGKEYLRCSTYVKVHSEQLIPNRLFNLSFSGSNLDGGKTIAMSFGSQYNFDSTSLLPWEWEYTPQPTAAVPTPYSYFPSSLSLRITGQSPFTGPKGPMRHVFVDWTGEPGDNVYYRIYERPESDAPAGTEGWAYQDTTFAGPSGSVDLSANYDWYIRVDACTKTYPNKCISSPSVFLGKLGPSVIPQTESTVPVISTALSPAPTVFVDKQVEELNKKVNTLQDELNESKNRQNTLERTVASLLTFIRNLFPHFGSN